MHPEEQSPWVRLVHRLAPKVRFPYLFLAMLGLFLVDLLLPDPIPFVDELLLGLLTVLLGMLRVREPMPPSVPPLD